MRCPSTALGNEMENLHTAAAERMSRPYLTEEEVEALTDALDREARDHSRRRADAVLSATVTAAIDASVNAHLGRGGSRIQDFDDRVQRAVKAADIEDAFGLEFERLEDRLKEPVPLTFVERIQHDMLERILVLACQNVEARERATSLALPLGDDFPETGMEALR